MNKNQKTTLLLMLSLGLFFFVLIMLILSFIFVLHGDPVGGFIGIFVDYHIQFMFILGLIGASVGITSYFSFVEQRKKIEKSHEFSKEIVFRFLDQTERKVVENLIEKEHFTQAHISKIQNIGKVKAHRVVKQLLAKDIIRVEEHGQTKKICFTKDIKKLFR